MASDPHACCCAAMTASASDPSNEGGLRLCAVRSTPELPPLDLLPVLLEHLLRPHDELSRAIDLTAQLRLVEGFDVGQ
jgi:hypothetical protein